MRKEWDSLPGCVSCLWSSRKVLLRIVSRTGEVPWVLEMIRKYHETAKATGAIVRIDATNPLCMHPDVSLSDDPADWFREHPCRSSHLVSCIIDSR